MEERIAKIEADLEQMDKRLRRIESLSDQILPETQAILERMDTIREEVKSHFRWILGAMIVGWVIIVGLLILG